jgi:HPt (histidine-containing phosphotransfer) domain-containing protein
MTIIAQNLAAPDAGSAAREKTRALLADLWRRNRPVIEERLTVLETAASAPAPMPEELRLAALDVAHKLSGSLGMFGFEQGTVIARELEQMLLTPHADTAPLSGLARQLREMLLPSS